MDDIRETRPGILIFAADPQSARTLIDGITASGLTIQLATSADFAMSAVVSSAPAALLMLPQRLSSPEGCWNRHSAIRRR